MTPALFLLNFVLVDVVFVLVRMDFGRVEWNYPITMMSDMVV